MLIFAVRRRRRAAVVIPASRLRRAASCACHQVPGDHSPSRPFSDVSGVGPSCLRSSYAILGGRFPPVDPIWGSTTEMLDVIDTRSMARAPAPRIVGEGRKRRCRAGRIAAPGPERAGGHSTPAGHERLAIRTPRRHIIRCRPCPPYVCDEAVRCAPAASRRRSHSASTRSGAAALPQVPDEPGEPVRWRKPPAAV